MVMVLAFDAGCRSTGDCACGRGARGAGDFAATILSARAASGWLRKSELLALLFQQRLARKLDAIALDAQNLDQYLIAFAQFVLHVFHAMLGNLTDVQQSVGAGKDLDKCTELGQAEQPCPGRSSLLLERR